MRIKHFFSSIMHFILISIVSSIFFLIFLNGYNYRPAGYSTIKNGGICSNNQSYNGIVFGKFKCPKRGFDLN